MENRILSGGNFIALITGITAVGSLSISIYLPSLPNIGREFAVDEDRTKQTVTLFLIVFGIAQLFYGPASDKYGRRPVLCTGISIFLVGTIICYLADSFEVLLAGRIIQAVGAGAGHALGRAIIRDVMSGPALSAALATVAAAMALSPALGPTIGGYLQVWFGWRSSFVFLAVVAAILLFLVIRLLSETNKEKDPRALKAGILLLHYWTLIRDRQFLFFLLCGGLIQMANFIWNAGAPFIFITRIGLKANEYGLVGLLVGLGYVAGTSIIMASKKWPPFRTMLAGTGLAIGGATALVMVSNLSVLHSLALMLPMVLICCGMGLTNPTSTALALERHPETAGSASSLLGAAQIAMGALGTASLGLVPGDKTRSMAGLILTVCCLSLFAGLAASSRLLGGRLLVEKNV